MTADDISKRTRICGRHLEASLPDAEFLIVVKDPETKAVHLWIPNRMNVVDGNDPATRGKVEELLRGGIRAAKHGQGRG